MVSVRIWALAAGVSGLIALGIYVAVIVGEGNNTIAEVAPWVVAMLVPSVLALVGATVNSGTTGRVTLLAAAVLFGLLGVVAIFSIGILFLVASVMSAVEYSRIKGRETASVE